MSEEVRRRAFEPFFTTKEAGRGTGLGLATVYGIVTQAEGRIALVSAPGRGATFTIWLPSAAPAEPGRPQETRKSAGGIETILLVEDEPSVRDMCHAALVERGYRVLECPGGAAALALLAATRDPVHLLLSDLVMPAMGGRELARRAAELRPGLRALFITGYPPDNPRDNPEHDSVLLKPFTLDELAAKIRSALDTPRPQA
jgi:CheY-like chemotaxis protein